MKQQKDFSSPTEVSNQFLCAAGVPEALLGQASDAALEESILLELEAFAKELPEGDSGGTRIIIAGRHFRLGEASWKLTTSLAALGISTLDPTGLTKVVALKEALDLLKELKPLLVKLDPGKLLVCSAVATVTAEKKRRSIAEPGASKEDIEAYFTARGEMAPVSLQDILKALESDKVLKATYYAQSGPFYTITF